MQLLKLNPTEIKVKEGLDRFRKDGGELMKLATSIQKYGQLQAIVINRQNEIIAGGRRLAACMLLNIPVLAMYQDTVDSISMREMELEENIMRKDFSPSEEALAVAELHRLKQEIYGIAKPGVKDNTGWTLEKTAEALGVTRGNVIDSLQIAENIKMFPDLRNCKTKSEIKATAKTLEKISDTLKSLKKHEEASKTQSQYNVCHQEAEAFLSSQSDGKYNCFLTDPPYGIDIQDTMMSISGATGGANSSGITFNDSKEEMELGIADLAKHLYRITTFDAQGYVFTAPEFFYPTRNVFIAAGWKAFIKPIIWIKNASGQNNQPSLWPSSCYEMILFLRKEDARLVVEGKTDWIQCSPIIGDAKLHPAEKPVALLTELLDRISLPGQYMIDPFMGSGSSLEAGIKKKLFVSGCDKLLSCYATSLKRMETMSK
jgi:DNA modification methylase